MSDTEAASHNCHTPRVRWIGEQETVPGHEGWTPRSFVGGHRKSACPTSRVGGIPRSEATGTSTTEDRAPSQWQSGRRPEQSPTVGATPDPLCAVGPRGSGARRQTPTSDHRAAAETQVSSATQAAPQGSGIPTQAGSGVRGWRLAVEWHERGAQRTQATDGETGRCRQATTEAGCTPVRRDPRHRSCDHDERTVRRVGPADQWTWHQGRCATKGETAQTESQERHANRVHARTDFGRVALGRPEPRPPRLPLLRVETRPVPHGSRDPGSVGWPDDIRESGHSLRTVQPPQRRASLDPEPDQRVTRIAGAR